VEEVLNSEGESIKKEKYKVDLWKLLLFQSSSLLLYISLLVFELEKKKVCLTATAVDVIGD
jgi:hypothetical protein